MVTINAVNTTAERISRLGVTDTIFEIENPWENISEGQKIVEIIYLSTVMVVGTIGNLVVIFSIIFEGKAHSHGNVFVINLAIADLIVTGYIVPTVLANVIVGNNALTMGLCAVTGFIVTSTCTCSVANLTAIAINRYYAVVHNHSYADVFTIRNVYIMAVSCWLWSGILSIPAVTGWTHIQYDEQIQICMWDDTKDIGYTLFIIILAIFIPLTVAFVCYLKLFLTVQKHGKWIRRLTTTTNSRSSRNQNRRSMRTEKNLLKTLATAVTFFCFCWFPYGGTVLINARGVAALPKKVVGWLGLGNSAVNFIIYGAINPAFRKGYQNLFYLLLRCKRRENDAMTFPQGIRSLPKTIKRLVIPIQQSDVSAAGNKKPSQRNSHVRQVESICSIDSTTTQQHLPGEKYKHANGLANQYLTPTVEELIDEEVPTKDKNMEIMHQIKTMSQTKA